MKRNYFWLLGLGIFILLGFSWFLGSVLSTYGFVAFAVLFIAALLTVQSLFTLYTLLYSLHLLDEEPRKTTPDSFLEPDISFSAIVPARHEEKVIQDTLLAIDQIDYPKPLKEIIVVCRFDDDKTIARVKEIKERLTRSQVKLVIFADGPVNKPHALNLGLQQASKKFVVVFDAEDRPHPLLYRQANTMLTTQGYDVLQSGVQLMNYDTSWFSGLNVLEYFFWFRSVLHFFAQQGVVPLGGNSVFFNKHLLKKARGWDEACLTEDAEIGIRLSLAGANMGVIYDERFVTKEETPHTVTEFIKQRTRWNQGFIQVLFKGEWAHFPFLKHRLLALYILALPITLWLVYLYIPFSLVIAVFYKLPVLVALLSYTPLYLLIFQLLMHVYGFIDFARKYHFRLRLSDLAGTIFFFIPFQLLLSLGSIRAVYRIARGLNGWEKTTHLNIHHLPASKPSESYVTS